MNNPPQPDLKQKLRDAIRKKELVRLPLDQRNAMLENLDEKLEHVRNQREKRAIKTEIRLLEEIRENELNKTSNFGPLSYD